MPGKTVEPPRCLRRKGNLCAPAFAQLFHKPRLNLPFKMSFERTGRRGKLKRQRDHPLFGVPSQPLHHPQLDNTATQVRVYHPPQRPTYAIFQVCHLCVKQKPPHSSSSAAFFLDFLLDFSGVGVLGAAGGA